MYHRWPRRLHDIDVCLVQPAARENRIRDGHYGSYEDLAAEIVHRIAPLLDVPAAFFGHCGGILPAVELTRQLHAAGLPTPVRLFASSEVAPHDGPFGQIFDLTTEQLADKLRERIVSQGGQPHEAFIEVGLRLLERDVDANRRYVVPEPSSLPCGITVIGWTEDDEFPMSIMHGWRQWTEDCREVTLEGGHYAFLEAPSDLLSELARF